ncbi:MAG: rhodanese-like domain-containing protein, partial [Bacteroidota bacterium]
MKKSATTFLLLLTLLLISHFSCSRKDTLEAEKPYGEITPAEVKERLGKGDDLVILDVRTKEEYESETGRLPGA